MSASLGAVQVRVLYADTDLAGVVYHANYLRFFEQARTELLAQAGLEPAKLQADQDIVFAVTHAEVSYQAAARYGEPLSVEVLVEHVGPARFTLGYRVWRPGDEVPCVTGRTTLCALRLGSHRVVRLPAAMREWCQRALSGT